MAKEKIAQEAETTEVSEPKEPKETKTEAKAQKKEELIAVMVPYIEGEDPEVSVTINYKTTKFKKGTVVYVKPEVAKVIANSNKQMQVALKNQAKYKMQVQDL